MHIRVENLRLAYTDQGQGQPVLLIHGYPLSRQLWQPQVEDLAKKARILAPDLPGHGESDVPANDMSMDQLAATMAAFLDALGVSEPVVVCGLSMGGYAALAFARRYPERTAGLVLTATRSGADSEEGRANRDKAMEKARSGGVELVAEDMLPKMMSPVTYEARPDLVDWVRDMMAGTSLPGMLGALKGMKDRPDATPYLGELHVPVLILHGEDDQLIPPSEAQVMKNHLSQARLVLIPQAGHLLNLEQPQAFNQVFATFLDQVRSGGFIPDP